MRTYEQLLSGMIEAWPNKDEIAQLTPAQIDSLRRAGNCIDNTLFLATPKGRAAVVGARMSQRDAALAPAYTFTRDDDCRATGLDDVRFSTAGVRHLEDK